MGILKTGKITVWTVIAITFTAIILTVYSLNSVSAHNNPSPDACNQTFTYEKSSDYDDARVHFEYEEDEHQSHNYKRRISLTTENGYSVVDIWLEVDGINQNGWDLHFTSALNDYNPNPGGEIENAKAIVKKVCPISSPTATPVSYTHLTLPTNREV